MNNFIETSYKLNTRGIKNLIQLTYKNKSPARVFHNNFLSDIKINGKVIDIGSGKNNSYFNYLKSDDIEVFYADGVVSDKPNFIKVDLEKNLNIESESFENVILFNVLEHIVNHKNLIKEIYRITKKNGKLELFVPFMHMYHPDPKDIFRPTHEYLEKMLSDAGFDTKTYLIGVGPFAVCSEILLKYVKIKFLKIFFFIIFLLLDKFIKLFSKDFNKYYNGIHCSCKK